MSRRRSPRQAAIFLTLMAAFIFAAPPIYLVFPSENLGEDFWQAAAAGFVATWIATLVVTSITAVQLYRKDGLTVSKGQLLGTAMLSYALTIYGFGLLYLVISRQIKCSFKPAFNNLIDSIYFSTTTIATVGFGDFVPNNSYTRALVAFEILVGVAYSVFFFSIIAGFIRTPAKANYET